MARRIAINLAQRSAQSNRGRANFTGRGRGREKVEVPAKQDAKDKTENSTVLEGKESGNDTPSTTRIRNQSLKSSANNVKVQGETVSKQQIDSQTIIDSLPVAISNTEQPSRGRKRAREVEEVGEADEISNDLVKLMGFGNFSSTKNKHVKGTDCYGINFKQKTEYRQYMNREGGFNRALSPTRGDRKRVRLSLKKKK